MESGTQGLNTRGKERERDFSVKGARIFGRETKERSEGWCRFWLDAFFSLSKTDAHTHTQTCILFYLGTHELAHTRTLHVSFFL